MKTRRIFKGGFMIAFSLIALIIVYPYMITLLTSAVFAMIFFPFYKQIRKRIKSDIWASLLMTFLIILLITIPSAFLVQRVTKDVYVLYLIGKQKSFADNIFNINCETSPDSILCNEENKITELFKKPKTRYYIQEYIEKFKDFAINKISDFLIKIPGYTLKIFIFLFTLFFLFKDHENISRRIKRLIPLDKKHMNFFLKKFHDLVSATVYGNILVALIQGAIAALGFFIFGITSPVTWGLAVAFCALIPFVGTGLVFIPFSLIIILEGIATNNPASISKGFLLLVYGTVIVASIDNVLKPKIIGKSADVHPLIVLLGVLGGLHVFGIIGILLGPIFLAFFDSILLLYENSINKDR